jgi:hypothetical protein
VLGRRPCRQDHDIRTAPPWLGQGVSPLRESTVSSGHGREGGRPQLTAALDRQRPSTLPPGRSSSSTSRTLRARALIVNGFSRNARRFSIPWAAATSPV